jgi:arsenite methyltransferase
VTPDPAEIKACCTAAYGSDAAALLLGRSYHPGGLALTRRLAGFLRLCAGQRVADVASGPGTTSLLLAAEFGVTVDGVELSEPMLGRARSSAASAGLSGQVRFRRGDAERLPLADGSVDAVICECAFCTFPGKEAAAAEFARVLRPGGQVGITDVTVAEGGLPGELATLTSWVACIAGAGTAARYADLLAAAGLRVERTESHDEAVIRMTEQIDARLTAARMTAPGRLAGARIDTDAVFRYTRTVRQAVADGLIGYQLLTARKPR